MSNHPISTIKGFIKGERIRYKRLCTHLEDFNQIDYLFHERLLSRGYTRKFLQPLFSTQVTLPPDPNPEEAPVIKDNIFNFVIRYANQPTTIRLIRKELEKIENNALLQEDNSKIRLAFKSNPNVLNMTMRSALSADQIILVKR